MEKKQIKPNRLIQETSPYLLQHAYNPVDWYPWGEEAFEKAQREGKPIFLSIGYSTCHWCHVMERESFEDEEVAELLNRSFVPIKVDREERPDIDSVYMNVCQAMTGQGGWPLTIFMTPEQKPFFAGTYFPKNTQGRMAGLLGLLQVVKEQWEENREEVLRAGEEVFRVLAEPSYGGEEDFSLSLCERAVRTFTQNFDPVYGGFGMPPKFPSPQNLFFLLCYSEQQGDEMALSMVESTLQGLYRGGIFDQIGYGFSRYSTDRMWLVPHFEKMLYDNALLTLAYLMTYQKTGEEFYLMVAEKTLAYLVRELKEPSGGFASAEDADSDGEEGKYYTFTYAEILALLGKEEGEYFCRYFSITPEGNFEGKNIPNLINNQTYERKDERIERLIPKVYRYRKTRTKLHRDDKVLTAWNGLALAAFARAYLVTGKEEYREEAEELERFLTEALTTPDGRLRVSFREGKASGEGFLDDYAYLSWGLVELYQATFEPHFLAKADGYLEHLEREFLDEKSGGYYLYARTAENLILRPKECYDGAMPSGNSVVSYLLLLLFRLTGREEIRQRAERQLRFLSSFLREHPTGAAFGLMVGLMSLGTSEELVLVTEGGAGVLELRALLGRRYLPNLTTVVKDLALDDGLEQLAPYLSLYQQKEGCPSYYLCKNHSCRAPVFELGALIDEL